MIAYHATQAAAPRALGWAKPRLALRKLSLPPIRLRWDRPSHLPSLPTGTDLALARRILQSSGAMTAHLALTGDKRLLFSPAGDAFLMYGVIGRSWIAMGDPVGPLAQAAPLARAFLRLCARHRGRPAFYRADPAFLPLYASLGLSALKLGEEATVPLTAATARLAGGAWSNLRQSMRRAEREGCVFEVAAPAPPPALLETLAQISARWLAERPTREKRFSCGHFDPAYVRQSHLAVVRQHGAPVAFVNFWPPEDGGALVLDLMRRDPNSPYGAMDFLFASLIRWGAQNGYTAMNIGMAPLAGCDSSELPRAWRPLGQLAARQAARFYNFAGLRRFKAKFCPDWRPKYLVCQAGLTQPILILDAAILAAGGLRGLIAK